MRVKFESVQQLNEEINRLHRLGYSLSDSWRTLLNSPIYQKAYKEAPLEVQKKFQSWKSILIYLRILEEPLYKESYRDIVQRLAQSKEISIEERIKALRELLEHTTQEIRNSARKELAYRNQLPLEEQINVFREALKKDENWVETLEILEKLGSPAKQAIPEIILVSERHPDSKDFVARVLKNIIYSEMPQNKTSSMKINLESNQISKTKIPLKAFQKSFKGLGICLFFIGLLMSLIGFNDYNQLKMASDLNFFLKGLFVLFLGGCFFILGNYRSFFRKKVFVLANRDQGLKTLSFTCIVLFAIPLITAYMENPLVNWRIFKFFVAWTTFFLIPFFPKQMLITNVSIAVCAIVFYRTIDSLINGLFLIWITIMFFYKIVKPMKARYTIF